MGSITNLGNATGAVAQQVNLASSLDHARIITAALARLADKGHVSTTTLERFNQYRDALLAWLAAQLANNSVSPPELTWSGWGWQAFVDNREIRIGLLTVYQHQPIPIHDHPGAVGILIVVDGTLRISNYQLNVNAESDARNTSLLQLSTKQKLDLGQFAFVTPTESNLHSLGPVHDSCTVLDILLTPYDESERCWYLPVVEATDSNQPFAAFRLAGRKFSNQR